MQVVNDAYVHGVSTRKIEKVAKALGIDSISRSQVSDLSKGLGEQISEFRGRKLDCEYPVLYADALYEKIRIDRRVENTAIILISAVNKAGKREILGFDAMPEDSEAREVVNEWLEFYNKKRPHWSLNGLTPYEKFYGVRLAKSA